MKIIKVTGYSLVALSMLASCKTVNKIAVPAGTNTVVEVSKKKTILTDQEKDNWQHLDLATDAIPGMSVNKAHEFLKGKKGVEVVVGVVDSGTDLKHEDLKDVAWVNTKEVAGNGIDDDKNGYVDDINGWNFLGTSYKEHLEYERILMNPSIASPELLAEVKKFQEEKVKAATVNKERYGAMLSSVVSSYDAISKALGKKEFSIKDVTALAATTPALQNAVVIAKRMNGFGLTLPQAKEEIGKLVEKANKTLNGDNLKTDYRTAVGDNAYDFNDKLGYGDANTGHSDKDEIHGSHVAGIIAATRNNGVGMNGVSNNVKLMAVRTVSDGDEYDKDVALGIRYAVDNGAKVLNTSFGKAFSPNKEWVYDAIKYAASKDVLIVNAAGNDGKDIDVSKTFPNDAPDQINEISDNFLTVGAMSSSYSENLPASFSNYGKINVDVFAPGVKIHSTFPDNRYKKISGTSMAAPNVAGVAALVRSYYPKLSASQVKHILMNSGTQIPFNVVKPGSKSKESPKGELVPFASLSVSGRIVNAYNALRMADRMVNGK